MHTDDAPVGWTVEIGRWGFDDRSLIVCEQTPNEGPRNPGFDPVPWDMLIVSRHKGLVSNEFRFLRSTDWTDWHGGDTLSTLIDDDGRFERMIPWLCTIPAARATPNAVVRSVFGHA